MIELYIIMAISFGIMFAARYTINIIKSVQEVAKIHKVKSRNLVLYTFSIFLFLLTIVAFPLYAFTLIFKDRWLLIHKYTELILLTYYDVELKNNS
jgi:hypothetical protein